MNRIRTSCPCGVVYELAQSRVGQKVRCSKCATVFVVGTSPDLLAPLQPVALPARSVPQKSSSAGVTESRKPQPSPSSTRSRDDEILQGYLSNTLEARMAERTESEMAGKRKVNGWKCIGFGIIVLLVGILMFYGLSSFEQTGGTARMNILIWLLYKIGGKWFVLIVLGGLGILSTVAGILCLRGIIWIDDDE